MLNDERREIMAGGSLFPAFLKLAGRKVVLVGGGRVAASKLAALRDAGAEVTVVAPAIDPEISRAGVAVVRRPFEPTDLDDAWFVVAAAPLDVNRQVAAAAATRRLFVNAVDDQRHASAYLGGVVRRDGVTLAVSTDGDAPALAGLLREGLGLLLPADLGRWMTEARRRRAEWKAKGVPIPQRRSLLLDALNHLYGRGASQSERAPRGVARP